MNKNNKQLFSKKELKSYFTKKVSTTKGKGIDRTSTSEYIHKLNDEIQIIIKKINLEQYEFSPYVETLKIKSRDKLPRLISIPAVRDRIVLHGLKEKLHEAFPASVPKKRPNQLIKAISKIYKSNQNLYYVKTDIENFYASINHNKLLGLLHLNNIDTRLVDLIEAAVKTPTVPKDYYKSKYQDYIMSKGVPQGLAISNILAQVYLIPFDNIFNLKKILYLRYVDDIVVVGSKYMCDKIGVALNAELQLLNLKLNKKKTVIASVRTGMTFLGYRFESGKISVCQTNIEKYIRSITGLFTWFKKHLDDKTKRPEWLIEDKRLKEVFVEYLNEKITGSKNHDKTYGWIFYFSEINDLKVLFHIDELIKEQFKKSKAFGFKSPPTLKRLVRAYYEIRYNSGGNYINDYNKHDTVVKKRKYLIYKGLLNPSKAYTGKQINLLFDKHSYRMTKTLEIATYQY